MRRCIAAAICFAAIAVSAPAAGANVADRQEAICRSHVKRWIAEHPVFYEEARVGSWSCEWDTNGSAGGYESARRRVAFNPWPSMRRGIKPWAYYDELITHEFAHAWGDVPGRLVGRETEYISIRGIDPNPVYEDHAEIVCAYFGVYMWWGDVTKSYFPTPQPTVAQIDTLRLAGFIPAREHTQQSQ